MSPSSTASNNLSSTAKGLGYAHRRKRKAMLPYAIGKPCPLCGELMTQEQYLDLDHVIPRSLGGADGPVRITHRSCNRARGNGTSKAAVGPQPNSRHW